MSVSSAAPRQLSDGNSQGTVLGQSANDLISFYNATPVSKATIIGSNTMSTGVSSTGAFGFGDATTASTVIAVINRLKTMGLVG